jgi:hypothetical protein
MVISSSPLRATYLRQNLAPIVVHVLVRYCVSLEINRDARIYGTLVRTPKVIKEKKKKKKTQLFSQDFPQLTTFNSCN